MEAWAAAAVVAGEAVTAGVAGEGVAGADVQPANPEKRTRIRQRTAGINRRAIQMFCYGL